MTAKINTHCADLDAAALQRCWWLQEQAVEQLRIMQSLRVSDAAWLIHCRAAQRALVEMQNIVLGVLRLGVAVELEHLEREATEVIS